MLMIQEKLHVNIKSKPVHVKRTLALRWLCPQLAVGKPLNPVHHIRTLHGRRFPPGQAKRPRSLPPMPYMMIHRASRHGH
jgi:hypothetical protein